MNINDRLSLSETVKLIARRVKRSDENARRSENRISHRISYAVKQGKIKQEIDGTFTIGNLSFWVNITWPGSFNDFPVVATISANLPSIDSSIFASGSMPSSIEDCHSLLNESQRRIATLEKENLDLKVLAEKYQAICTKNQNNAKKNRRYRSF